MPRPIRLFLLLISLCAGAHAQVNVNLEVKRRTFIRHEPILLTVTIQNLSGRDLILEDGSSQWFGFAVFQGDTQTLIPPRNPDYTLDPLELKIGETIKRTVNLVDLFPISEYGIHRVRATIYCKSLDKYFTSRTANLDISEGRTVWKQIVGVPDTLPHAGEMHEMTLLSAHANAATRCRCVCRESGRAPPRATHPNPAPPPLPAPMPGAICP